MDILYNSNTNMFMKSGKENILKGGGRVGDETSGRYVCLKYLTVFLVTASYARDMVTHQLYIQLFLPLLFMRLPCYISNNRRWSPKKYNRCSKIFPLHGAKRSEVMKLSGILSELFDLRLFLGVFFSSFFQIYILCTHM